MQRIINLGIPALNPPSQWLLNFFFKLTCCKKKRGGGRVLHFKPLPSKIFILKNYFREVPGGPVVRTQHLHCWGLGSIPMLGRSPREENDNPLQYSCLENPLDRGAWRAIVHRVTKSRIRLSDFTFTV